MTDLELRQAYEKLLAAAREVWNAYLEYGPVDDGRPEGDRFSEALDELMAETVESRFALDR